MPGFIATYDLVDTNPSPHGEFLDQAVKQGWELWIEGNSGEYRLPNTTLVGDFPSLPDAEAALKATRTATENALGRTVTMPKWMVAIRNASRFNSDQTR